jgi:hypothetical protein
MIRWNALIPSTLEISSKQRTSKNSRNVSGYYTLTRLYKLEFDNILSKSRRQSMWGQQQDYVEERFLNDSKMPLPTTDALLPFSSRRILA